MAALARLSPNRVVMAEATMREYTQRVQRSRRENMQAEYIGPREDEPDTALFDVVNASGSQTYSVWVETDGCRCTCPDWARRNLRCKHIFNVLCLIFRGMQLSLYTESMTDAESAVVRSYNDTHASDVSPASHHRLRFLPGRHHGIIMPNISGFEPLSFRPILSRRRRRTRRGGILRRGDGERVVPEPQIAPSREEPFRDAGKPINEDVCFCQETYEADNVHTHCYVCGTNAHVSCLRTWHRRQRSLDPPQQPSCPSCRAIWRVD